MAKELFKVFGEFDSAEEINMSAEGLLKEGDMKSILALAIENGLDQDDANEYINGDTEELTDVISAALGKLKIEKESENNLLVDDVTDFIKANCDDLTMAIAVRRKGKRTMDAAGLVAKEAKKNTIKVQGGTCNYCGPMRGYQIIKNYYLGGGENEKETN